ncbi:MAG TPA: serine hydrolase domain-containing protein [Solirubrobacteraceae bacterium]|jgi:CubicO group peptidase (beta-lactamase class C family)|nr:serine hydrolase domain-containing protein [Solirubrobacteraceae bacterium]
MPTLPRLPLIPDPLRRIHVPRDLEPITTVARETDAGAAGLEPAQVDRIWDAAVSLFRAGVHPALQLCVRRNGHVVLDRAIGHARGNGPDDGKDTPKVLATTDTPFCVYSTSKGITALVVHMLAERGAFEIDDRVTDFIPEYGRHGKGGTTIGHVLAHRAGVASLPRELLDLDRIGDREFILEKICDTQPSSTPGTLLAYHAVTGGFILGEIVERTTGRTLRDVLGGEILEPLGFRWGNYGVAPEDVAAVGRSYVTGAPLLPPLTLLVSRALGRPLDEAVELSNDPRFLTAVVPAASVMTSAHELSRFFEIFRRGGELDGVHVIAPATLRRALTEQSRMELDYTLVFPTRFSYGLMLGAKVVSLFGLDTDLAFGHLGLINIMGWADPERGVSAALITSGKPIVYPEVVRFYMVMQRVASEVPKLDPSERPF